ncbi:MAG: hypothetical protein RMJ88_02550 [Thermogemmata sp.]|nr:hypothetical protein [Thermogemmata sp.]
MTTPEGTLVPNEPLVKTLDGVAITAIYRPPEKRGKNQIPSELRVSTSVTASGEFHLLPETFWDRLGKRLGIAQEVTTGDAEFDERCYIRSDTPLFAAAYLSDPVKRIAFLDMQRLGFSEMTLHKGELTALWPHFDPAKDWRPELLDEAAARLVILSRDLPDVQEEAAVQAVRRRIYSQWFLWAFLIVFAIGTWWLGSDVMPWREGEWLLTSLPLIIVSLLAFAVVTALLLRGTSTSHHAWFRLMGGALLCLPFGSCEVVSAVNALTDTSPPQEHHLRIIDKYVHKSKRNKTYRVVCQSWRNPLLQEDMIVTSDEYALIVPGQSHMYVVVRAGGLGLEWIAERRVVPNGLAD